MDEDYAKILSTKDRALIITPAGYGKTEIIARAISYSECEHGKSLILTHTHAGVKAIHERLRKLGVSKNKYFIDTIAGFSLQYTASFPVSSGLGYGFDPSSNNWNEVYKSAKKILSSKTGKNIIGASFSSIYVDEYQDCSTLQHQLILELASILPCRIVGDPLQGIFDFRNEDELVNWYTDVFPNFEKVADSQTITIPWRWIGKNEALGDWLKKVRVNLYSGKPISFENLPVGVRWLNVNRKNQYNSCIKLSKETSVVAIAHLPHEAHNFAKSMRGVFTSMEEVECKDLLKWSDKLEKAVGIERADLVVEFASICMTKISTELSGIREKIKNRQFTTSRKVKYQEIFDCLIDVVHNDSLLGVFLTFKKIENIPGRVIFRRELWGSMCKALNELISLDNPPPLKQIAWSLRHKERILGRQVDTRIVSRTLLIKGLEFDHAVILNADDLTATELYVALTRGSKSLTVLSSSPEILKPRPNKLHPPTSN